MLAHQHGACCSWAEHDAHADSLAAVAATGAEEAEAEKNENEEKEKARVRDRRRRAKAKTGVAELRRRNAELEAMPARCADDNHDIEGLEVMIERYEAAQQREPHDATELAM